MQTWVCCFSADIWGDAAKAANLLRQFETDRLAAIMHSLPSKWPEKGLQ